MRFEYSPKMQIKFLEAHLLSPRRSPPLAESLKCMPHTPHDPLLTSPVDHLASFQTPRRLSRAQPSWPLWVLRCSSAVRCHCLRKRKSFKVFDNSAFQYKGQKKRDQGNESFLFCNKLIHKCSSWLADYMNLKKIKFISRCCFERNAEAVCVPITIFSLIVAFLKHKENVYAVIEMCIFSL